MPRRPASRPPAPGIPRVLRASLLAALCAVAGSVSHAVVLGPAALQSRTGEALQVEIPVRRFKARELPGLSVRIGDEAAYAEAQLTRPDIASQLQVELVPRGEYLRVRVRSAQPVTESKLDLVLVVRWQAGRAIRPFTLLLDGSGPLVVPASSVVVGGGDTASRIAADYKGDQATLEQMLMALLQANPDAFIDGNVNRLRVGAVLELPAPDAVARLDAGQARALVAAQEREFLQPKGVPSGKPAVADTKPLTDRPAKSASPAAPADRLTLSKPVDAAQALEREQKLAQLAREDAQRIDELQRNIAQLNQTIAELNRSVEALQRKSAQSGTAGGGTTNSAQSASSPGPATPPAPLIETLLRHPATPWAGAGVMALLLGLAMLRIRQRQRSGAPGDDAPASHRPIAWAATDLATTSARPQETSATPAAAQGLPASVQGLSLDLDPLPQDPAGPHPGGDLQSDDPIAVKLALAEEFRALGSLDAARDMAREVEALADEPLKSRARHLLGQLG